jgi:hypothetical protein
MRMKRNRLILAVAMILLVVCLVVRSFLNKLGKWK